MTSRNGRQNRQEELFKGLHEGSLAKAPFALRITRHQNLPPPVLVIKQRRVSDWDNEDVGIGRLQDQGRLHGDSLRRLLPIVRAIASRARNESDISLEINVFLSQDAMRTHRTLVLDEEAGTKLGIIFKLQQRLSDLDRAELLSRRVAKFSREESVYWFSRITHYGPVANRWAVTGLRTMLCGGSNSREAEVEQMLAKLRARQ